MDSNGICLRAHIDPSEDRQGFSSGTSLLEKKKNKLGLLLINHSNKFGNVSFHLACNLLLNLFFSFKAEE